MHRISHVTEIIFLMRIPLCFIFGPDGRREFSFCAISESESESILTTAVSSVSNRLLDVPKSVYLGLIHRTVNIQLFGYISCTGWVMIIGLEHGLFDGNEVAQSLFDKLNRAIVDAFSNPFYTSLRDSSAFNQKFNSAKESHSVMMKFMTSASLHS